MGSTCSRSTAAVGSTQTDNDPIAVLQVDGNVLGKDDQSLGKVGVRNASLPGHDVAWLSIGEQGEVTHFDANGNPVSEGTWTGCGAAIRACTLTTHLQGLGEMRRGSTSGVYGPTVGIGVGLGLVVMPWARRISPGLGQTTVSNRRAMVGTFLTWTKDRARTPLRR